MKKITFTTVFIVVLCSGVCFVTSYCFSQQKNKYNLLLITIDTLRDDHLGCYGYFRDTSPFIDKFAQKGFLFKNAITSAPVTVPSHASIFTGTYPSTHGALTNGYKLNQSNVTLAEILKENGYRTAAFVAAKWVLGEQFGLDQGFDTYSSGHSREREGSAINHEVSNWLETNVSKDKGNFFIWLHYYDVHCGYQAPEPYFDMFYPDYKGNLNTRDKCGRLHFNNLKLSDDDFAYIRALYDGEIRYVDNCIEKVIGKINDMGISDETIIIITADHGESLAERRLIGHNLCLYDYEIRVPLIIVHPSMKPTGIIIDNQVELISLMPTILDMLGIEHLGEKEGASFLALLKGKPPEEKFSYIQTALEKGHGQIYAIRNSQWKLILYPDNRYELYELKNDPHEKHNLAAQKPALTKHLGEKLRIWMKHEQEAAASKIYELRQEVKEKLKSLGYINQ